MKSIIFDKKCPVLIPSGNHCISDLIPYSMNNKIKAELKTSLKEYKMLLNASLEATDALSLCELHKFDAHVGENACQIRAVWIAIIANNKLIDTESLKNKIKNNLNKIETLLEENKIEKLMRSKTNFMDILTLENLLIPLSFNELYAIQCFLLTEARTTNLDDLTISSIFLKSKHDVKKLKKYGDVSSQFINKFLRKGRKHVAKASVQLVREGIHIAEDDNLAKFLSDEFTINHNNHLKCTPMFWTYKSILAAAINEKIPLVIQVKFLKKEAQVYKIVDNEWLLFDTDPHERNEYKLTNSSELKKMSHNRTAWVVQGVVYPQENKPFSKDEWRVKFLRYPVNTTILAGAADHRQYPNEEQDEIIHAVQDHEYETYKSLAKSEGFSLENPTTFFIQHVYPSKLAALLKTIKH